MEGFEAVLHFRNLVKNHKLFEKTNATFGGKLKTETSRIVTCSIDEFVAFNRKLTFSGLFFFDERQLKLRQKASSGTVVY